MKFNKLSLCVVAGMASVLCSCSNEDSIVPNLPDANDGRINFSTYLSRGQIVTSDNISQFGVLGYYNGGDAYASTTNLIPDFMYNQQVNKSGDEWAYNPIKYWPNNSAHKISFLAYAPFTAAPTAVSGGASGVTALSANDYVGDPTLNYEVGTSVAGHQDLVYASAIDQTNANTKVHLNFRHALSRLSFQVKGWEESEETFDANTTVTVNSVKIATTRKSATLNLKTGLWSDPVDVADNGYNSYSVATRYSNIQNNVLSAGDTEAYRLNLDDDYIMMFPDLNYADDNTDDPDQYIVFVDYTVKTIDPALETGYVENRQNVYRRISPEFIAGKSYVLTIHLGMNGYTGNDDGDPVDPDVTPDDPDPDPDEPVEPTPPSEANYVKFSLSVTDWDQTAPAIDIPLVKHD